MSFETWLLVIGTLLLLMALAYPVVERLPITTTIVYLLIGIALGPWWHGVLWIDPIIHAEWLQHATELAIVVSLFTVGMKLRLSLLDARLRPALCLAFVSMTLTVGLITAAATWLLALPLGAAVLLGGILAPTDPVLASDVQTKDPHDQDRLRLTLTAEGGLNDGTAYPFVMLGLGLLGRHQLGEHAWRWWLVDGLWAVVGGLGIGAAVGYGIGQLVLLLNARRHKSTALGEYVVLGLIGVSYGIAVQLNTSGFLAVFAAGVALRAVERAESGPDSAVEHALAEAAAGKIAPTKAAADPKVAPAYFAGALLATNEQIERILEVALVLIVGAALMVAGLSFEALWFAPLLFFVIRPLSALPLLLVTRFTRFEFGAISWFGIRGIGSIYYVMFALGHHVPRDVAETLVSLTFTIVALSILAHGVSVTPLLNYYARAVKKTGQVSDPLRPRRFTRTTRRA
jgi:NhaP-type Na+/H+ or K+/H+ antiporter